MQLAVIVNELHIARLKLHGQMQVRIIGKRIKQIKCFDMGVRQARRINKPLRAFDILALLKHRKAPRVP